MKIAFKIRALETRLESVRQRAKRYQDENKELKERVEFYKRQLEIATYTPISKTFYRSKSD